MCSSPVLPCVQIVNCVFSRSLDLTPPPLSPAFTTTQPHLYHHSLPLSPLLGLTSTTSLPELTRLGVSCLIHAESRKTSRERPLVTA